IAATLTSTGTPAFFLHAGEGSHGDLGTLVRGDVLLAVSNSGESAEVLSLLPLARRLGLPLIAVCGNLDSTLARSADVVLDVSVPEEACPLGLAPTASTTATMALGDALAIALLEERGFSAEDFALLHPAGALGRRLLRVEELMHRGGEVPLVPEHAAFTDTLVEMTSKRLGVTGVVNGAGQLVGVITDGDLRLRPRAQPAPDAGGARRRPRPRHGGARAARRAAPARRRPHGPGLPGARPRDPTAAGARDLPPRGAGVRRAVAVREDPPPPRLHAPRRRGGARRGARAGAGRHRGHGSRRQLGAPRGVGGGHRLSDHGGRAARERSPLPLAHRPLPGGGRGRGPGARRSALRR